VSHHRTLIETTIEMPDVPMMASPTTMRQIMHSTQTVVDADGDTRILSIVVDSVEIDAPALFSMMGQGAEMIEGLTQRLTITTRGEILDTETEASTAPAEVQQAMGTMQDIMSGLSLELPVDPVRWGATWTVPVEKSVPLGVVQMNQAMEFTYRFERLEIRNGERHAVLSFAGPMSQEMSADSAVPMQMEMQIEGDVAGTMNLNIDAGRVEEMTMTMGLGGLMIAMGREMTMAMTMTMEQSRVP
jgi:hypothetical protein